MLYTNTQRKKMERNVKSLLDVNTDDLDYSSLKKLSREVSFEKRKLKKSNPYAIF